VENASLDEPVVALRHWLDAVHICADENMLTPAGDVSISFLFIIPFLFRQIDA
jgi:hypothetical protein